MGRSFEACFDDFPFSSSLGSPTDAKAFMDNVLAYCSMFSICPNGTVFRKKLGIALLRSSQVILEVTWK